jgi:hypothetical protein
MIIIVENVGLHKFSLTYTLSAEGLDRESIQSFGITRRENQ